MDTKKNKKYSLKTFVFENKVEFYKLFQDNHYKRLTIKSNDQNELVVLSPKNVNENLIHDFVIRNAKKILVFIDKKQKNSLIDIKNKQVLFLGKKFRIKFIEHEKKHMKISFMKTDLGNEVYFFTNKNDLKNEDKQRHFLISYIKKYGTNFLTQRVNYYCHKFNLKIKNLEFKQFKRKWGWCSSQRVIALNVLLVCHEIDVINYVICHELAHLTHLNHSKAFWNLVEQYCPNWKIADKKLKYQWNEPNNNNNN